jgi:acyl-[acyl-carrier-protein]-phospholipid O-acyltransferase / long-chain-fatty-acid--[acyl-carrier-protein] ligase
MKLRSTLPFWIELPGLLLARILYRVRVLGGDRVPARGGAILIANHLSYVDGVVLQLACGRPIRFLSHMGASTPALLRWLYRRAGVIEINPAQPLGWLKGSVRAVERGELVCVFAEGAISRTGQLMALRRGYELIARQARAPVIPVAIDGLWGSVFSFAENRYLWKSPRLMPTPVCVAFGEALPWDQSGAAAARKALMAQWITAFGERPMLRRNIGREVVRALCRRPRTVAIVDRSMGRRVVTSAQLVAAAAVLSRRLRRTSPEQRVGIVLPPGAGAAIANLAVMCAGKVPVNLNFTAGRAAVEASIAAAGLRTIVTADAMRSRFPEFPWTERTVDLAAEIRAEGGKRALAPWLLAAFVLPNQWTAALIGVPRHGDSGEAALLFTSGSSGNPKGVVLSHRNLLANCSQVSSMAILPGTGKLLGCLPVFHSFGFTFTMWYPLLRGCLLVTIPSPLDTRAMIDSVREEEITVLIAAPTFIRPLLKKATSADLRSLELVVTGAEKLTDDIRAGFRERFHIPVLEGYGLTETSPVANVNQPHPPVPAEHADEQIGNKVGTVGRLLPGMSARIVDPETGAEVPDGETGVLCLKGPNIFSGYLDDAGRTHSSFRDGWFITWDLARIDEDGFVAVEGRLARFSKIGGEMVPHGTVEQKIIELFQIESDTQSVVVVGVPDESKGEALVALTTAELAYADIRERLVAAGLPNLWIPKTVVRVPSIPLLGTGKLDLGACKKMAAEARAR